MSAFFDIRAQARRDIHAAFSVSAQYNDTDTILQVRWHDRFVKAVGDFHSSGYAEVLENIDKILFNEEELADKAVTLVRGDRITLTDFDGFVLVLDTRDPKDGPIKISWNVTRP